MKGNRAGSGRSFQAVVDRLRDGTGQLAPACGRGGRAARGRSDLGSLEAEFARGARSLTTATGGGGGGGSAAAVANRLDPVAADRRRPWRPLRRWRGRSRPMKRPRRQQASRPTRRRLAGRTRRRTREGRCPRPEQLKSLRVCLVRPRRVLRGRLGRF